MPQEAPLEDQPSDVGEDAEAEYYWEEKQQRPRPLQLEELMQQLTLLEEGQAKQGKSLKKLLKYWHNHCQSCYRNYHSYPPSPSESY